MDEFSQQLNDLLVEAYRSLSEIEEQMVKSSGPMDLSIGEIHLIEAVGRPDSRTPGHTISDLSEATGLSLPSVTIAINKLVKKGYVEKARSALDGRMVHVTLTKMGVKVMRAHQYFHRKMISAVTSDMTEEEKGAMTKGFIKLNAFLDRKIGRNEEP